MKLLNKFLLILTIMAGIDTSISAQSIYHVRTIEDCSQSNEGLFKVKIYTRSKNEANNFNVGHQNYRLTYNHDAISNPVIIEEGVMSGFVVSGSNYSFYGTHTLTGSIGKHLSYNTEWSGGVGYTLTTAWTLIGIVQFEITNPELDPNIKWLKNDPNPIRTTVLETDGTLASIQKVRKSTCKLMMSENVAASRTSSNSEQALLKPNPGLDYTNLLFQAKEDQELSIKVYDLMGKIVYQKNHNVFAGANEIELQMQEWNTGIYIVNLSNQTIDQSLKLIKNDQK